MKTAFACMLALSAVMAVSAKPVRLEFSRK